MAKLVEPVKRTTSSGVCAVDRPSTYFTLRLIIGAVVLCIGEVLRTPQEADEYCELTNLAQGEAQHFRHISIRSVHERYTKVILRRLGQVSGLCSPTPVRWGVRAR